MRDWSVGNIVMFDKCRFCQRSVIQLKMPPLIIAFEQYQNLINSERYNGQRIKCQRLQSLEVNKVDLSIIRVNASSEYERTNNDRSWVPGSLQQPTNIVFPLNQTFAIKISGKCLNKNVSTFLSNLSILRNRRKREILFIFV